MLGGFVNYFIIFSQAMSKDKLDLLRTRIVEELEPIYGAKVIIIM